MLLGTYEPLLKTIKRRKLKWFGHVSRYDNLCKTIMQGSVEGTRKQGRPKSQWIDNIAKWTKRDVSDQYKMCTTYMAGENVLLMPLRLISPTIYESRDNK